MDLSFPQISPRAIVSLSRALIVVAVLVGVGCLEAVARLPKGNPLQLHMLVQSGAGALMGAFLASVAIAAFAAYADVDKPRCYPGAKRW